MNMAGRGPQLGEQLGELFQLLPVGQAKAQQQQEGGLLKAEAVFRDKALDQILHADAPVIQFAGHGNFLPVLDVVALDRAHLGQAGDDAGAVGVAQAPLYVGVVLLPPPDVLVVG